MSYDDYQDSKRVNATGASFTSLIMAALRVSEATDYLKIKTSWPGICAEFWEHVKAAAVGHKGNNGPPEAAGREGHKHGDSDQGLGGQ